MGLPKQVEDAGLAADQALKGPSDTPPVVVVDTDKPSDEGDRSTVEGLSALLKKAENRYNVLQGMYNSHVAPIKDDVNALVKIKGDMKRLEKLNGELQTNVSKLLTQNAAFVRQVTDLQGQVAVKPAAPENVDITDLLSEEDRKTLNKEGIEGPAIDVITKLVAKLATPRAPAPEPEKPADAKVSGPADKVATAFWDGLDSSIADDNGNPIWSPINKSPEFIDWLSQAAPYNPGKTRHEMLIQFQNDYDLNSVVSMFKEFMAGDSYKKPEKPPEKLPDPPEVPAKTPEQLLENEIEPDRSQNIDVNLQPVVSKDAVVLNSEGEPVNIGYMLSDKVELKGSDITMFYKDATQTNGLRIRNVDLYNKIDAAISKAGAEGRVNSGK